MKKYLQYAVLVGFFCYWLLLGYKALRAINYEFNGRVQKVTSTSSYYKIITVNNKDFDLEWVRWYDGLTNVEVGDSVMKKKGNQWMEIIKK
ncbi:hypothetical protein CPT03_00805 [Pedobacter ginsengisoli]|uniref:Uncharacterized protein n=1 Tax=Pedobacter ginsengisoli TaxID=363852 RepID=A0A2D1U0I5_9SPHI|nr:hypothetical protein [Pedobacter ginsengisoli]ATP55110.1 hypothetical protein CPT03_00805 [Pedobacter ginsengisoli]